MKTGIPYILSLLLLLLLSCEEEIDWKLDSLSTPLLVVEGMITNEKLYHQVKLTETISRISEIPASVSGAYVVVHDGSDGRRLWEKEPGSGIYEPQEEFRGVFGKVYSLYIRIGENVYTASTRMLPVAPLDPIRYRHNAHNEDKYQLIFSDSDEPSMIEYNLDWSHLSSPGGAGNDSSFARIVHYNLKSIDVSEMFKPGKETIFFPGGTRILRKKYSLSEEHQEFVRTLLSETEWRGGLFDVQPGNVKTNLSEGAVGYFSASTVVSEVTSIPE